MQTEIKTKKVMKKNNEDISAVLILNRLIQRRLRRILEVVYNNGQPLAATKPICINRKNAQRPNK